MLRVLPSLCLLFATLDARADEPVRIVSWNLQTVGTPGTTEYEAAVDVLARIGADVVGICEINGAADIANFEDLAVDLGYTETVVAGTPGFGASRCGVMSSRPVLSSTDHTAAKLAGDPAANDLSRTWTEVVFGVGDSELTVVTSHLKSGTANADEYRRVIEATRGAQVVADLDPEVDAYVIMGDFNADVRDPHATPASFSTAPTGLPTAFVTGRDITAAMASGLDNDPFAALADVGEIVDAVQPDGSVATRPSSGRRLDYVIASDVLVGEGIDAEVYDAADEGLPALDKAGSAPSSTATTDASDHLPVFVDVIVPTYRADHVVIRQVAYDTPGDDSKEEYVQLYNPTASAVSLGGWTLSDNSGSFTIPAGTTIAAYGTLTVARNAAGFLAWQGVAPDVAGFTRSLSNTSDVVSLERGGVEIDRVAWGGYDAGWTLAASSGQALYRVDARVDADAPADWTSSKAIVR